MRMLKLPPGRDLRAPCPYVVQIGRPMNDWPSYWLLKWSGAQAWMKTRAVKRLSIARWPRLQRVAWDADKELL
jgi:hypothetical protein